MTEEDKFDINGKAVESDGSKPHSTKPWQGNERTTVILYRHKEIKDASEVCKAQLRAA